MNIAPSQLARSEEQQRQSAPYLSLEMQDGMGKIVPKGRQRAVHMGVLPAIVAMVADQGHATVEAITIVSRYV